MPTDTNPSTPQGLDGFSVSRTSVKKARQYSSSGIIDGLCSHRRTALPGFFLFCVLQERAPVKILITWRGSLPLSANQPLGLTRIGTRRIGHPYQDLPTFVWNGDDIVASDVFLENTPTLLHVDRHHRQIIITPVIQSHFSPSLPSALSEEHLHPPRIQATTNKTPNFTKLKVFIRSIIYRKDNQKQQLPKRGTMKAPPSSPSSPPPS